MPASPSLESLLRLNATQTQLPLAELRILMEAATGLSKVQQITQGDKTIPAHQMARFENLTAQRAQGMPIAYLINRKEFYSRNFFVDPRVLIPRPETEELVEHALSFLQNKSSKNMPTRVLDMGCGSGVIGLSIALENPMLEVTCSDISADALWVATHNASKLGAKNIRFIQSDLFKNLLNQTPSLTFDLICSNPPYIEKDDEHLNQGDLRFEPRLALTDHADGLHFYREIAKYSPCLLRAGGGVLVEHGYTQQHAVTALFAQKPYVDVQGLADLGGTPRFVFARINNRCETSETQKGQIKS